MAKDSILIFVLICLLTPIARAEMGPIPESVQVNKSPVTEAPFNILELKNRWLSRIESIRDKKQIPIIDLESSFNSKKIDPASFAENMDELGIAAMAMSAQVGRKKYFKNKTVWSNAAAKLISVDPWRYIPVTTAGIYPVWTEDANFFLEETMEAASSDNYLLLGEFEFRHYMSPRQYRRDKYERDVEIPIDGPDAETLFKYSAKTGLSFQIHYEIEDRLLPALEKMLAKHPKAKVVWCHLAQIRYQERSKKYNPTYVESLIKKYPNLYFDLAFGSATSVYPGSDEHHSRIWDQDSGGIKAAWKNLIIKYPYRFLAALDLGGDRMNKLSQKTNKFRDFLSYFPAQTQEIIAYKAAWKLLFNEQI